MSRMVAAGELDADDGRYVLGERFRRRQVAQDAARTPAREPWDGTWWLAVVGTNRRSLGERRAFRAAMQEARLGELRPDVWLRPANVEAPAVPDDVLVARGTLEGRDPADVAAALWDLDQLAARARTLTALVDDALGWLAAGGPAALADTFLVSVGAVRFLRTDPRLPRALVPGDRPAEALRAAYDRLEAVHASMMADFLAGAAEPRSAPRYSP
jgi:phenylacetic acid degradation operon negative regulatory protein